MWIWLVLACAPEEPWWVESCDCPVGELCVSGGVAACVAPPPECADAYGGGACELAAIDEACTAALCGFVTTPDGGIEGSYATEAECWEQDGPELRWFDCDAPLTF